MGNPELPRGIEVIRHSDKAAETVRAAICDDQVIQVVGRGRGVNRTADDPLDVHVLADVALPLVCDRLTNWDFERPDMLQRMLLAGVAVDSPADAARLHPDLLQNEKRAQKVFELLGFGRQTPISTSYRELSLKSAVYRRPGRGRSRQRAWWIGGADDDARRWLEARLSDLAAWQPDG